MDLLLDQLLDLGLRRQVGERRVRDLPARRPIGGGVVLDLNQRRDELAGVADGDRLLDVRARLERVLDLLGRKVLSARGDE